MRSATCMAVPLSNVPGAASHTSDPQPRLFRSDMYVHIMASVAAQDATICHRRQRMHCLAADQSTFAFRPDVEPVLRVRPGEIVRFETSSEPVEHLFAAGPGWTEAIDVRAIN